jgi:hypothetical protein
MSSAREIFREVINNLTSEAFVKKVDEMGPDMWKLQLEFEQGGVKRAQTIQVAVTVEGKDRIVRAFSLVGPFDAALGEKALKANGRLSYTRVAVMDNGGKPYICVAYRYPLEELGGRELVKALRELAESADVLEMWLFGKDQH